MKTAPSPSPRLPRWLVALVFLLAVLPLPLMALGVDFGSTPLQALKGEASVGAMHKALSGGFTHTLLEWSAVCAALFTL